MIELEQHESFNIFLEVKDDERHSDSFKVVPSNRWYPLPRAFRDCAGHALDSVLLETAKQDGTNDKSFLFLNPVEQLIAWSDHDLNRLCADIDRQLTNGMFVAGYFAYECGEHFVGLPRSIVTDEDRSKPLAWLGIYESVIEFNHATGGIHGALPTQDGPATGSREEAKIATDSLQISKEDYRSALTRIDQYLHDGHTYQVNFTDRVNGHTNLEPLAIYEALLKQQPVPFAVFINRTDGPVLSFSPELFFRTSGGRIVVRPMKGTWRRGNDLAEDREAVEHLRDDEKNRSEHVMIVDLLRNDIGRICKYGSVQVDELFHVETYSTLLQMTSTCSGVLLDGLSPSQVFANLFPSGSITGAPKRRTMEIIRELEHQRRGVYTGSIGYFGPGGEGCFNVAIRTVKLQNGLLTMGVGGGITAGSDPDEEFEECRLKAAFLTSKRPPFAFIETMLCEGRIALLPLHMQRLSDSAQYFCIRYDEQRLLSELTTKIKGCGNTLSKVRVELSEGGDWCITAEPLVDSVWNGRVLLADERIHSGDLFRRHKTTNRGVYEQNLIAAQSLGFDEVLFLNERSTLAEGAISNVFIKIGGVWTTPTLKAGALPGVQRTHMIQKLPEVEERDFYLDELSSAQAVCVCNALRGVRPVFSIAKIDGTFLWEYAGGIPSRTSMFANTLLRDPVLRAE